MADYQLPLHESVRKPAPPETKVAERAPNLTPHPLVALQSRAGNQAVARMVQRAGEEDELQMKHDASLQRESEGGGMEEEEALQAKHDPALQRAAEEDELQMMHDRTLQRESEGGEMEEEEALQAKHDPALQRESEGGEMEEEEPVQAKHDPALQRAGEEDELQMKHDPTPRVGLEGGPVGGDIESRINSARGQGASVPDGIRGQMEEATGTDLSGVRVHQDQESDILNRQMTAKAFTTGSDIFLRSDASTSDSRLMGHELAHVVQQSSGRTAAGGAMSAGAANDPLEHEADQLADSVLSGRAQRHAEEVV